MINRLKKLTSNPKIKTFWKKKREEIGMKWVNEEKTKKVIAKASLVIKKEVINKKRRWILLRKSGLQWVAKGRGCCPY